jgi:hypothetical protein
LVLALANYIVVSFLFVGKVWDGSRS